MEPRLYIVMRRDLWDMNPGKGMAQAAHAQSDFDAHLFPSGIPDYHDFLEAVNLWREDRSFGTTLVLHEPLSVMNQIHERVVHTGMTVDPTYPYRNHYGELFVSNEVTCMWAFAYTEEDLEYMQQWRLHQ
jgi:peptidyl-tRNA hydrolase